MRGDVQHLPGRHVDDPFLVVSERQSEDAFEDVRELFVVVRVLRDDRALLEVDVGDHHRVAGDEPAADLRIELLPRQIVPPVVRRFRHDPESMDRWATFDCYGTLIDWNGGIGRELERLFGAARVGGLLHAYHHVEPEVQREAPTRSYRDVLTVTLARLAELEHL